MSITALFFLMLFGSTLLLALIRHPIYGLYAYFLAFYGFPPGRWWGLDLPDLRWSLIAAAVTLIGTLRLERIPNKPSWYADPVVLLLMAFSVWLWLQQFWALAPVENAYLATMYTKYVILYYLIHRIVVDEKTLFYFFLAHVVGCAYFAWLAFGATDGGRIEYIGGPNMDGASEFATHLSTGLIFAGILLFQTRGIVRMLVLISIPFILNAIILTQSRGAFLGLMAGGLVVLYFWPPANRKKMYSAGILAIVLFFMLAHDAFWERMETIDNAVAREEMDTSAAGRWELIGAQWKMFYLHPIRGTGHRGTVELSDKFLDEIWMSSGGGRSSHNTLMTIVVEHGVPGVAIYFSIILWAALRLKRTKELTRTHLPNSLGMLNAAIAGALGSLFVAGQFADFLRLEVTIWCIVLLSVVSRLAQDAVYDGSGPAVIGRKFGTAITEAGPKNRSTVQ